MVALGPVSAWRQACRHALTLACPTHSASRFSPSGK